MSAVIFIPPWRALKQLALNADTTVQALIAEALATFLQNRGVTIEVDS